MKINTIFLICLLLFLSLSFSGYAVESDVENKWEANNCSCSPNVSKQIFGSYDVQNEEKDEFIDFSVLTRIEYFHKVLGIDGELSDSWKKSNLESKMKLAKQFNTKIDLGIKIFFDIKREKDKIAESKDEYESIAKKTIDLGNDFFEKQKEQLKKQVFEEIFEQIKQILERIDKLDDSMVKQDENNRELMKINEKLDELIGLFIKINDGASQYLEVEDEKVQVQIEKDNVSKFKKIIKKLNIFIRDSKKAGKKDEKEDRKEKIKEMKAAVDEILKEYRMLSKKQPEIIDTKKKSKNKDSQNLNALKTGILKISVKYTDCITAACKQNKLDLEDNIKELLVENSIPKQDIKTIMEEIVDSIDGTPLKVKDIVAIISDQMIRRIESRKKTKYKWMESDIQIDKVVDDIVNSMKQANYDGLTIDLTELESSQKNTDFINKIIFKLDKRLERDGNILNIVVTGDNITRNIIEENKSYVGYFIIKVTESDQAGSERICKIIGDYIHKMGTINKLLLYITGSDLDTLSVDEGMKDIVSKNTGGLFIDEAVYITDDQDEDKSAWLRKLLAPDQGKMFFAKKLLYHFNEGKKYNICWCLCPQRNFIKAIIYSFAGVWIIVWMFSWVASAFVGSCFVRAWISKHFMVFWGIGGVVFAAGWVVVLCDPYYKENRDNIFTVFVIIIVVRIIFFILEKAGAAR
jgi:uncharacterized membrane protein YgdD (TMEM256/DUF423 family)